MFLTQTNYHFKLIVLNYAALLISDSLSNKQIDEGEGTVGAAS